MEKRIDDVLDWYKKQPKPISKILKYPIKLFVRIRIYVLGKRLIRQKKFMPPTTWTRVTKDGTNVNLGPVRKYSVICDGLLKPSMLIGCYKDGTVRLVYNVPDKYHKIGSIF